MDEGAEFLKGATVWSRKFFQRRKRTSQRALICVFGKIYKKFSTFKTNSLKLLSSLAKICARTFDQKFVQPTEVGII